MATRNELVAVTVQLQGWFEAEPWRTSRELFEKLQAEQPGSYPDGQLRTLQRRVKGWRRTVAHSMVFGQMTPAKGQEDGDAAVATGL